MKAVGLRAFMGFRVWGFRAKLVTKQLRVEEKLARLGFAGLGLPPQDRLKGSCRDKQIFVPYV